MLLVTVVCSDPGCADEREVAVENLDAVDETVCECGYGYVVVCISELGEADEHGEVISLPKRRRSQSRRAA
jgi:hypothetical protein